MGEGVNLHSQDKVSRPYNPYAHSALCAGGKWALGWQSETQGTNKDRFCKTMVSVAFLTPKFKEICDCRQRKFPQAEIQNKRRRKVSLKPR